MEAFKYWYDESCKTDGIDNYCKDDSDYMSDYQISKNVLRAFKCVECMNDNRIPILNESSTKKMTKFMKKTKKQHKKKTDLDKVKQDNSNKDYANTGIKTLKEDNKTNIEDETTNEADSLDMEASLGVRMVPVDGTSTTSDEFEFLRIKSDNGVIKLADGEAAVFKLKSHESSSSPSNYGMYMIGSHDGLTDLVVTVVEEEHNKLVAKVHHSAVSQREIFDIMYDEDPDSPGAFRLKSNATSNDVGTNNGGSLVADTDKTNAKGMILYRYTKSLSLLV